MFDELASIFFFSSAGGDADSYRAAAIKPGTPAGSPSPARAAAGGSRCGSASQGFPRPALSSPQLTFGMQFVFPTRMIPKNRNYELFRKIFNHHRGKVRKEPDEALGRSWSGSSGSDRLRPKDLGFHWLDKDRIN